jgi:hypothetical protein
MTGTKPAKSVAAVEPCVRFTPEQLVRNKKEHDERRRAIRNQNARSKSLK